MTHNRGDMRRRRRPRLPQGCAVESKPRSRSGTAAARIRCLAAAVAVFLAGCGSKPPDAPEHPGKAVYERYCYACHQAGIAAAPKFGDKEAWASRLAKTRTELVEGVKRGIAPGMPPRAGCPSCSDEELEAAVDFMVRRVQ